MARTLSSIINGIIGIIILLLSLRLILRLFGASSGAPFTQLIYNTSAYFLTPFQGIFPTPAAGGAAFELSTLFAIIIYAIIGWLLTALIDSISNSGRRKEVIVERHRVE